MGVAAAAVIVPMGLLFFISGLVVNFFQALFFVIVRPFSKNTYRRINRVLAELLWLELVWLADWWAGLKIQVYADRGTFEKIGKEHALLICNHRSDIDWLVGWVLAQRYGCLGSAIAVMKKSLKYLPVIGWSMWFNEYLFLERSWAKDEKTIKIIGCLSDCAQQPNFCMFKYKDYPLPFWLALFVEGTRFTPAKLRAAQEYASSTGLPIPRNVLIPRTKGFVSAVKNMKSFVPAIYDITVAIPKSEPSPTMLGLVKRQSSVVHVHIKRVQMQELPESEDAIAQWCKEAFMEKDALLDKHKLADRFPDGELRKIDRPVKSLVVVIGWSCGVILGALKFLQLSSLLSTWKGIACSAGGLAVVTLLMQILILSSQSERSTPAKITPLKPKISAEPSATKQI